MVLVIQNILSQAQTQTLIQRNLSLLDIVRG